MLDEGWPGETGNRISRVSPPVGMEEQPVRYAELYSLTNIDLGGFRQ